MKRKYSTFVLSCIIASTGFFFQNCSQPSANEYPAGSTTNTAGSGNTSSGGINVDSSGNSSPSDSGGIPWGDGAIPPSTTPTSSSSITFPDGSNAQVTAASSTELKVKITFDSAHVGALGAIYVIAYYNNIYYFWDATKPPQARWVATDLSAATYPEFISGNAPASGEITITEMVPAAHGAKIYVAIGFGGDAATRRNEVGNAQRYKEIFIIP